MKRFLIILLTYFISINSFAQVEASNLYEEITKSLVTIVCNNDNLGSGFFIGTNLVVTNLHVIEGANNCRLKIATSESFHDIKSVVAVDTLNDLVILKLDFNSGIPLIIEPKPAEPGTEVYSFGSPQGLEATFAKGIISSKARKVEELVLLQHNASISQGSSGGPLVNKDGRVVGVNVGLMGDGQNLNFAIPASILEDLTFNMTFGEPIKEFNKTKRLNRGSYPTIEAPKDFSKRTKELVIQLGEFISIIADKEEEDFIRQEAIKACIDLFISPESIIEVSSKYRDDIRKIEAKNYFPRLYSLSYEKVEVSWHNVIYISDLKRGPDGRYYGILAVEQKFSGYNSDNQLVYSDITVKHIEIVIEKIESVYEDEGTYKIFLRSIRVNSTS